MKRFFLSAVAAAMLATTGAYADNRPVVREVQYTQNHQGHAVRRDRKVVIEKKVVKRKVVERRAEQRKVVTKKQRWGKGQRMSDWRKREAVRDYRRHGLRQPGRNQQWIRVDNSYILIGVTSGIIASILAGR